MSITLVPMNSRPCKPAFNPLDAVRRVVHASDLAVCDVSINTVSKLLVDAGTACAAFHADNVKGLKVKRVQCDEIWSFCFKKQSNTTGDDSRKGRGDLWTWTAIDADSKLIISWMIGDRDLESAKLFVQDLKDRLATRIQLTTDGHRPYLESGTLSPAKSTTPCWSNCTAKIEAGDVALRNDATALQRLSALAINASAVRRMPTIRQRHLLRDRT